MSDHQFEKNVRKQLEELKFHPNAAVWTSVEKRIAMRKKKNRGIIWIPLLLLLTGGSIYFLERNQKDTSTQTPVASTISPVPPVSKETNPNNSQPSIIENNSTTPGHKQQPSASRPSAASLNSDKLITRKGETGTKTTSAPSRLPVSEKVDANVNRSLYTTAPVYKKQVKPAPSKSEIAKTNQKPGTAEGVQSGFIVPDEAAIGTDRGKAFKASLVFAPVIPLYSNMDHSSSPGASLLAPIALPETPAASIAASLTTANNNAIPASAAVPPVEKRKSTFQWGVNIEAGFSNITEGGFFDVTEKSLVQDVASNSYSSPLPANAVLPMPSNIRPAPAYAAGVFIRKAVSKKIALSAGLGYSLLQTSIQVGQYTQANLMVLNARGSMGVDAVYRAGTQQEYKNQFHFLELPFEASWRLNKRRQYPIALNTGIILARLVSSNALHFDGATRVYYEDNSLFNKTQLGFSGGLSIGFLQKTAHPVTAGPFFHYRATNLMKYPVNGERHLLSFGLNMKVLVKK